MGPGYAQMNDLVIIQTTQGLAAYVKASNEKAQANGVVMGYDGRHNSKRYMVKICIIHYHILCMRNKTWRNQRTNFS
jgi:phosphomannomutase